MPTVDVELHAGESAAKPSSFVDRDATRNSRARIGEKSLQKDAEKLVLKALPWTSRVRMLTLSASW
jgi:hypothetical protein